MPRFKTKDLLVTVLPAAADKELAKKCMLHTKICRSPTIVCGHQCSLAVSCGQCSITIPCGHCSVFNSCLHSFNCPYFSICPGGSFACDPTFFCPGGSGDPYVIENIEDLVSLRAELQDTLKQLDVIQKEGLPSSITSRAEAESLEQSLMAALEQVRAAKKSFK